MADLFTKLFALSISPQACGTDALYRYFSRHRDVALPRVREVFFFDRHFHRGADFYKSYFADGLDVTMFMELSSTLFDTQGAPGRVKDVLGKDARLFCVLRDPVARSLAVYDEYKRYGIVKGGLREACGQAPQILFASRYADHLPNWLSFYPDLRIVSYEDLYDDPEKTIGDLSEFLGLPIDGRAMKAVRFYQWLSRVKKYCKKPQTIASEDRAWVAQQLEDEAARAEKLIGKSIFKKYSYFL
ncbi:MAG: sulfotransferase domain-containing protein [Rhodospirillales bacterium]|nr:sulfotransferase domain-containing protein [Rhodospirillales bacterium]